MLTYVYNDGISGAEDNATAGDRTGTDSAIHILAVAPHDVPTHVWAAVDDSVGVRFMEKNQIVVRRTPIAEFVLERIRLEQNVAEIRYHNICIFGVFCCPCLVHVVS